MKRITAVSNIPWAAAVVLLGVACTDDDPCEKGQIYEYQICVDPPEEEPEATAADDDSEKEKKSSKKSKKAADADAGTGDAGAQDDADDDSAQAVEAAFGDACTDVEGSSDCGGDAPICLPQIFVCSNILCQDGEPNAGVCPAGWICLVADPSQPSVCLDPAFLQ